MNGMNFDFSVMNDGEVEDFTNYCNYSDDECQRVLQTLVDRNLLTIGERSTGNVSIENDVITMEYRWCSEVGEDWDSDVWEDEHEEIPVTEVQ